MKKKSLTPVEAMLNVPAEWRIICDRIEQTGGGFPDGTGGDLMRELYRIAFEHRCGTPLTATDPYDGVIRSMARQLHQVRTDAFVEAISEHRTFSKEAASSASLDVFADDDSTRAILAGFLACEAEDILADIAASSSAGGAR